MHNKSIVPSLLMIVAAVCTLAPFIYIYQQYRIINPFSLNGKQFLVFYMLLSCTSLVIVYSWSRIRQKRAVEILLGQKLVDGIKQMEGNAFQLHYLIVVVLTVGIARLIQGISNHKPVGYLVMLLVADLALFLMFEFGKQRP